MKSLPAAVVALLTLSALGCGGQVDRSAPAVYAKDSASMMVTWGVNTLISDSGVIRYRIVGERWEVNTVRNPTYSYFDRGLFLEQFDESFHVQAFLECDTAWLYDKKNLWELRGNVKIRTGDGTKFFSEELYWDQMNGKLYSFQHSKLITTTSEIEGTHFESDEPDNFGRLNHYLIDNSKGFIRPAEQRGKSTDNTNANDSTSQQFMRPSPSKAQVFTPDPALEGD